MDIVVTVERGLTTTLNELQELLVRRIDKLQERLGVENYALTDQMAILLSIGQMGLLTELYESGLRPKQIKEITGIMWQYPTAKEEEKIRESKTSGIIYQANKCVEKLQDQVRTRVLF